MSSKRDTVVSIFPGVFLDLGKFMGRKALFTKSSVFGGQYLDKYVLLRAYLRVILLSTTLRISLV